MSCWHRIHLGNQCLNDQRGIDRYLWYNCKSFNRTRKLHCPWWVIIKRLDDKHPYSVHQGWTLVVESLRCSNHSWRVITMLNVRYYIKLQNAEATVNVEMARLKMRIKLLRNNTLCRRPYSNLQASGSTYMISGNSCRYVAAIVEAWRWRHSRKRIIWQSSSRGVNLDCPRVSHLGDELSSSAFPSLPLLYR